MTGGGFTKAGDLITYGKQEQQVVQKQQAVQGQQILQGLPPADRPGTETWLILIAVASLLFAAALAMYFLMQ